MGRKRIADRHVGPRRSRSRRSRASARRQTPRRRRGLPFVPGARTLKRTSILALDTALGETDLLVDPDGADRYEAMRERALRVDLDGVEVRVVGIDDLLSIKRAAGRPQDVADVDALLTAQRVERRMRG